jgi:hypothetical protein
VFDKKNRKLANLIFLPTTAKEYIYRGARGTLGRDEWQIYNSDFDGGTKYFLNLINSKILIPSFSYL